MKKKKSEAELTAGILKKKDPKTHKQVKDNTFYSGKTRPINKTK